MVTEVLAFFALGVFMILVNFFIKSVALSLAVVAIFIGICLWPEVNQWLQYGALFLMVGGLFTAMKYGFQGV